MSEFSVSDFLVEEKRIHDKLMSYDLQDSEVVSDFIFEMETLITTWHNRS